MNLLEFFKIVLLCVLASVVYGILHDMVTAHVAVEYFTVFHPTVVHSESPVVMALVWGLIATWWMGAGLGVLVGLASQVGVPPFLCWRRLVKPVGSLLMVMALCAATAGVFGFRASLDNPDLFPGLRGGADPHRMAGVWFAHNASYFVGFFGGIGITIWVLWKRIRMRSDVL